LCDSILNPSIVVPNHFVVGICIEVAIVHLEKVRALVFWCFAEVGV
jgi:hypothetical protein